MNSFDVFDTLIARRYINSDSIFQTLQRELNAPGFLEARKRADSNGRNLYQIYDSLVEQGIVSPGDRNRIINREIELEMEACIPVQSNLDRVQDGDMLISDMYLPASAILALVRSAGLNCQVTLYQSGGDKSTGSVWRKFKPNTLGMHLGDNQHSDYKMPITAGIHAEWFNPATDFNDLELTIFNAKYEKLAFLSREIRLRNNLTSNIKPFFDLANGANLPLLFMLSELIYRRYSGRNIVFLGRDCQLLHSLYESYYGLAYYLPFSRKVAYQHPETAIRYLQTHSPENAVYFDMSSTGGTWEYLNAGIDICVAIYSDIYFYTPTKPKLPAEFKYITSNSVIGATGFMLEVMNCGNHGPLSEINHFQDQLMQVKFGEPEILPDIVRGIHLPFQSAKNLKVIYRDSIRKELASLETERLIQNFGQLAVYISEKKSLLSKIPQFFEKENAYTTSFSTISN